jgi:hypothetical protein
MFHTFIKLFQTCSHAELQTLYGFVSTKSSHKTICCQKLIRQCIQSQTVEEFRMKLFCSIIFLLSVLALASAAATTRKLCNQVCLAVNKPVCGRSDDGNYVTFQNSCFLNKANCPVQSK